METTIAIYSTKMRNLNQQLLLHRIQEIESQSQETSTESQKLDLLAETWFHESHWPSPGERSGAWSSDQIALIKQAEREEAITTLQDARTLEHPLMGGVIAPSFGSERGTMREAFVEELENIFNERFGEGVDGGILMPVEFREFLQWADGVQDLDFRREGICEWRPVPLGLNQVSDSKKLKSELRMSLEMYTLKDVEDLDGVLRDELEENFEVKGGIECGMASIDGETIWYSYYLFTRKMVPGSRWGWIIVVYCASDARVYLKKPPTFESISLFLEWYASGRDRIY